MTSMNGASRQWPVIHNQRFLAGTNPHDFAIPETAFALLSVIFAASANAQPSYTVDSGGNIASGDWGYAKRFAAIQI